MGAVFGIYAGIYYWLYKLTGKQYSELLGRIHFFSTFLGVNLTFMPMHFIGLAGMPRRIPDYPDAYSFWNLVISAGSALSIASYILFGYIILTTLQARGTSKPYSQSNPHCFLLSSEVSMTLEWLLPSPPSYHSFLETPIVKHSTSP